ncbi:MAG: sodium:solute symporter family protein [bacterium]|nr:sodium:solute symporter family protein [bacterium]
MAINLQLIIISIYFGLLLLAGWLTKKYTKTSTDYLIAGRNLGVTLCTVSIIGEWLGGMSTVGTAEKAYATGFFPIWYNISTAVGMALFGFLLAAVYRKSNVHTVGEMMEKLYSRHVRIIVSFCFVTAFIILTYIQLQTVGGVAAQVLDVGYSTAVVISGVLIIIYVFFGGMRSIALTNLIHVILLYTTLVTIFIIVLVKMGGYGGLFEKLAEVLPLAKVEAFKNPFSQGYGKVLSWILGGILAGFASQASIQPVFAARDIKTAKRSAYLSALFIAPVGILVSTLAMAVRTGYFGGLPPTTKETLPYLLMNPDFLPPWLSGLAMAGILAAILSTVAPVMFAVSTILTRDIYFLVFNTKASDKKLLHVSRGMVIVIGLAAIPPAIFLKGGILDTAYITYAIRGAAAIAVLLGVFRFPKLFPSPTPLSVNVAMITATLASICFVIFKNHLTALLGFTVDKVYAAIFFTLFSIIIVTWSRARK